MLKEIPYKVKGEPEYLQRAYVNEFEGVLESTGSSVRAIRAADKLLDSVKSKPDNPVKSNHQVVMSSGIEELATVKAEQVLPDDVYNSIKENDPNPFFGIFEIGKEGVSTGKGIRKVWSFGAIKELADKIKDGAAKLIKGHTKGDKKPKSLGEVVYSYTKKAGKALKAYAVAHIPDKDVQEGIRNGDYDICSVEGDVLFTKKPDRGEWFIEKVNNITNLALANSATDKAGFEGAGVVGVIQELEKENQMPSESTQVQNIDIYSVKVAIERNGWKPEDLFNSEQITSTPAVKELVESKASEKEQEMKEQVEKLEGELKPLKQEKIQKRVEDLVDDSELLANKSDAYRRFVKKQINVDASDKSDDQLKAEVDSAIKAEMKSIKDLGITFGKGDENDSGGDGNNDNEGDNFLPPKNEKGDGKDMTDPKNNPYIPSED